MATGVSDNVAASHHSWMLGLILGALLTVASARTQTQPPDLPWRFRRSVDPMTDEVTARLLKTGQAINVGGSWKIPTLSASCYGTFFQIEVQFNFPLDTLGGLTETRVRIDQAPLNEERWGVSGTNAFSLQRALLLDQLLRAKTLRVQVRGEDGVSYIASFNVAGLRKELPKLPCISQ